MPRQLTSGLRTPVFTSLPASPVDGQEIIYRFAQTVNPVDAAILNWRLRYDATAGAWLPVGRQEPVYAYYGPMESTSYSANTWGGVSTNDPSVTIPRNGDYEIEWGVGQFWVNASGNWYVATYYPGSEQTPNGTQPASDIATVPGTGTYGGGHASKKITGMAVGQVQRQRYYITVAGTVARGSAYVKAYPRKITG